MVPLYPSQSQSLPASGFPNGQQDGQVDTTLVSKKRPRDDRSEEWEFHRQAHRMKETQMIDERSGEQSLIPLGHGPQQQESISSIINNRPGEFKMMTISDKTWNPVFSWAGKHLKMNKEKSATVQDFMQRFEEEQQKLNNMLPFQHNYKKIQVDGTLLELIQIDRAGHQGIHDFIILPTGIRGPSTKRCRGEKLKSIRARIEHILRASELFHRLAVLHEFDLEVFGTQSESTCKKFMNWLEGIFFTETEDGLPLFGSLKETCRAAEQSGKRFGGAQKEISILLAQQKRSTNPEIYTLSLSLLGYWYKMEVLKLGRLGLSDHSENL
ncbi:hypothetical protein PGT21_028921 [Puccinia graminis f. sp. tritici]|uniref:Uncharacterized protein n=1 Tax=Puccinia graminis f. sp. tritici TaxID=56615 RepID=A0A5B0MVQ2_PUCGR|nr:hypothetical protein PGT21_028921 [Puccinia graminis f. sp. tritici]KAA1131243.1 hypothetical protein PGTUg99_026704 [Puccinia graminis f. sp. tritici]